jgi:hypothetical protein
MRAAAFALSKCLYALPGISNLRRVSGYGVTVSRNGALCVKLPEAALIVNW